MKRALFFACLICSLSLWAEGTWKGKMFGDYYWIAQHNMTQFKNRHGMWLRRIYLTYLYRFDEHFRSKLNFEVNSADFTETGNQTVSGGGTFSKDLHLYPKVKDAYLEYEPSFGKYRVGIQSSPTFELVEHHWGYRWIEKSPRDLWKWGSSRDFGLGVLGKKGIFSWHFVYGNGNSNKNETTTSGGKKLMLALQLRPFEGFVAEVYGDWLTDQRIATFHGFVGYKKGAFRAGAFYGLYRMKGTNTGLYSFYVAYRPLEKTGLFARVDGLTKKGFGGNAYVRQNTTAKPLFVVAGLEQKVGKNISFSPNVEYIHYSNSSLKADIIPRLSFLWKF